MVTVASVTQYARASCGAYASSITCMTDSRISAPLGELGNCFFSTSAVTGSCGVRKARYMWLNLLTQDDGWITNFNECLKLQVVDQRTYRSLLSLILLLFSLCKCTGRLYMR